MEKNYYEILGVDKTATPEEIKKAYRKIAIENHPDKKPGDKEAEELFKQAAEAYSVLSSPEKRQAYDNQGQSPFTSSGDWTMNMENIFSMFGDIFGGRGSGFQQRGHDLQDIISITPKEAIEGCKKTIKIRKNVVCPDCHGTGGTGKTVCPDCHGRGYKVVGGNGFFRQVQCQKCSGTGAIFSSPCPKCGSAGIITRNEDVELDIRPGTSDGSVYTFRGYGSACYRGMGSPGDLYIKVLVDADERFEVDGRNVHYILDLPLKIALTGGKVKVPLPVGGEKEITIEPATQYGKLFGITGGGIAGGDFLIHVKIEIPKLTNKQKKIIDETL